MYSHIGLLSIILVKKIIFKGKFLNSVYVTVNSKYTKSVKSNIDFNCHYFPPYKMLYFVEERECAKCGSTCH